VTTRSKSVGIDGFRNQGQKNAAAERRGRSFRVHRVLVKHHGD